VAIKLVVLGFFVLVCFKYVKPANWHPFAPNGFHGVVTGAAIVFFAYIGFDAVSTTAEECRDPKRDLPIGIIGSLIICMHRSFIMPIMPPCIIPLCFPP